jgi:hypothetical protein
MRSNLLMAILLTFCVTACDSAKSPATVEKDVAKAEQKAAVEVAKSEDNAAKDLNAAAAKVDDKVVEFDNTAAKDAYDLAMANADGDHRIALANCESSSGDAQKQCKDQVEADYAAAKAKAVAATQSQRK